MQLIDGQLAVAVEKVKKKGGGHDEAKLQFLKVVIPTRVPT